MTEEDIVNEEKDKSDIQLPKKTKIYDLTWDSDPVQDIQHPEQAERRFGVGVKEGWGRLIRTSGVFKR